MLEIDPTWVDKFITEKSKTKSREGSERHLSAQDEAAKRIREAARSGEASPRPIRTQPGRAAEHLPEFDVIGTLKEQSSANGETVDSLLARAKTKGLSDEQYATLARTLAQTNDKDTASAIRQTFTDVFSRKIDAKDPEQLKHAAKETGRALDGLFEAITKSKDIPPDSLRLLAYLYAVGASSEHNQFIFDTSDRSSRLRIGDIGRNFKEQTKEFIKLAGEGNEAAIHIVAALAGGAGTHNSHANALQWVEKLKRSVPSDDLARSASVTLIEISEDPALRKQILDILTSDIQTQLLPDSSRKLETLGLIASKDPDHIPASVHEILQKGLTDRSCRASALKGMAAISHRLDSSDIGALTQNLSAEMVPELRKIADKLDKTQREELINGLAGVLLDADKIETKQLAAQALMELSPYATAFSIYTMGSLRSNQALIKLKGPDQTRLEDIKKLQDTMGSALLQTAITSTDQTLKNQAVATFAQHDYHNKDSRLAQQLRTLLDLNPENITMQRLVPKIGLELPPSTNKAGMSDAVRIACIFGNFDPKTPDDFLLEQTKRAIANYGAEKVEKIAQRIALYNSLTRSSELSKELLGTTADGQAYTPVDPLAVLGQLSNKSFGDSTNAAALLSNLEENVAVFRKKEQQQIQTNLKELVALYKVKETHLKELSEHASEGVGWYTKLLSSVSLSDGERRFIDSEREKLSNIKDVEAAIQVKVKTMQGAIAKEELLGVVQGNQAYVNLVNGGKTREADLLALSLFERHGNLLLSFAPAAAVDLAAQGEGVNCGVLHRLHENGVTQFDHVLTSGNKADAKRGLEMLAQIKPRSTGDEPSADGPLDRSTVDFLNYQLIRNRVLTAIDAEPVPLQTKAFLDDRIIRNTGLRLIDADPVINKTKQMVRIISEQRDILATHLEMAAKGGDRFACINDALARGKVIKNELDNVTPEDLTHLRQLKEQIAAGVNAIEDKKSKEECVARLRAIDTILAVLDPQQQRPEETEKRKQEIEASIAKLEANRENWKKEGPYNTAAENNWWNVVERRRLLAELQAINAGSLRSQIDKMLADLDKPEFQQESNFKNWLKKDGVELLGSTAGVVGAIALEAATFGEATPALLSVMMVAGGGMVGAEATKEGQYWLGWRNQGALAGVWLRSEGILQEDGSLKPLSFGEMASSYGTQLTVSAASNLVSGGFGGKLGEILGKMSGTVRAAFIAENKEALAALANTTARLNKLANENPGFAALLKRKLASQFKFVATSESIEHTDAFEQAKKELGQAQALAGFLLNVGLSTAEGGYRNYGIGKVSYLTKRLESAKPSTSAKGQPIHPILQYAQDKPILEVEIDPHHFDLNAHLGVVRGNGYQILDCRSPGSEGSRLRQSGQGGAAKPIIAYGEDGAVSPTPGETNGRDETAPVYLITPHGDVIRFVSRAGCDPDAMGRELVSTPSGRAPETRSAANPEGPAGPSPPPGDKPGGTTPSEKSPVHSTSEGGTAKNTSAGNERKPEGAVRQQTDIQALIPEATRKAMSAGQIARLTEFIESSTNQEASAQLIEAEVKRGAKPKQLNYDRLSVLEELCGHIPYNSEAMQEILKLETTSRANLEELLTFILDGDAKARTQLIEDEAKRNLGRAEIDVETLANYETLQKVFAGRKEVIERIRNLERENPQDIELHLARLCAYAAKDSMRAKVLADEIMLGSTGERLHADRLDALVALHQYFESCPNVFSAVRELEAKSGLDIRSLARFIGEDRDRRTPLVINEVERGGTKAKLDPDRLSGLVALQDAFKDSPNVLQTILTLEDTSGLRLKDLAKSIAENPAARSAVVVEEITRGAKAEQLTNSRLSALFGLRSYFPENSTVMRALREQEGHGSLYLEDVYAFIRMGKKPDAIAAKVALIEREAQRGPGATLNPGRLDAIERLEKYYDQGSRTMQVIFQQESSSGLRIEKLIDLIEGDFETDEARVRRAHLVGSELNRGVAVSQLADERFRALEHLCTFFPYNSESMRQLLRLESTEGLNLHILSSNLRTRSEETEPRVIALLKEELSRGATVEKVDVQRLLDLVSLEKHFSGSPETIERIRAREQSGLSITNLERFISYGKDTERRRSIAQEQILSDADTGQLNSFYGHVARYGETDQDWVSRLLAIQSFRALPLDRQAELFALPTEHILLSNSSQSKDHILQRAFSPDKPPDLETLSKCLVAWQLCPSMPQDLAAKVGAMPPMERMAASAAYRCAMKEALDFNTGEFNKERFENVYNSKLESLRQMAAQGRHQRNEAIKEMWKEFEPGSGVDKSCRRTLVKLLAEELFSKTAFKDSPQASDALASALTSTPKHQEAALTVLQTIKAGEFVRALTALRDEGSLSTEDQNRAALDLVLVFGSRWRDWLNSQSGKGRTIKYTLWPVHDALKRCADYRELPNLGEWLLKNREASSETLHRVAWTWQQLSPAEQQLSWQKLYPICLSKFFPGYKSEAFATEAGAWDVSDQHYQNWEARWLKSQSVPSPFPLKAGDGKRIEWKSGKLTGYFLSRDDPRGLFLGHHTNSCQHPDGVGETCAWHGQESPDGGFFVVQDDKNNIVAMSWAWVSSSSGLCFDNCEAKGIGPRQNDVARIYQGAADDLTGKFGFHTVTMGKKMNKLRLWRWESAKKRTQTLPDYENDVTYTDADEQVLLSHNPRVKKVERTQQ
jgi:hypothetical protein